MLIGISLLNQAMVAIDLNGLINVLNNFLN